MMVSGSVKRRMQKEERQPAEESAGVNPPLKPEANPPLPPHVQDFVKSGGVEIDEAEANEAVPASEPEVPEDLEAACAPEPRVPETITTVEELEAQFPKFWEKLPVTLRQNDDEFTKKVLEMSVDAEQLMEWMKWARLRLQGSGYSELCDMASMIVHKTKKDATLDDDAAALVESIFEQIGATKAEMAATSQRLESKEEALKIKEEELEQSIAELRNRDAECEAWCESKKALSGATDSLEQSLNLVFLVRNQVHHSVIPKHGVGEWSHYNYEMAYGKNGRVYPNWSHPYFQGYEFGVWLMHTRSMENHNSPWFGADKKPKGHPMGIVPVALSSYSWFNGIKQGLVGRDFVGEHLSKLPLQPPPQYWEEEEPSWIADSGLVLPWKKF